MNICQNLTNKAKIHQIVSKIVKFHQKMSNKKFVKNIKFCETIISVKSCQIRSIFIKLCQISSNCVKFHQIQSINNFSGLKKKSEKKLSYTTPQFTLGFPSILNFAHEILKNLFENLCGVCVQHSLHFYCGDFKWANIIYRA